MRVKNTLAQQVSLIFILRRVAMILVLVIYTDSNYSQIVCLNKFSVILLAYTLHAQPYKEANFNTQEAINETLVLMTSYSLFMHTEIISRESRYSYGWVTIFIIGLNVVINVGFMAMNPILRFKLRVKRC